MSATADSMNENGTSWKPCSVWSEEKGNHNYLYPENRKLTKKYMQMTKKIDFCFTCNVSIK